MIVPRAVWQNGRGYGRGPSPLLVLLQPQKEVTGSEIWSTETFCWAFASGVYPDLNMAMPKSKRSYQIGSIIQWQRHHL